MPCQKLRAISIACLGGPESSPFRIFLLMLSVNLDRLHGGDGLHECGSKMYPLDVVIFIGSI
jgi:hypothetical protein